MTMQVFRELSGKFTQTGEGQHLIATIDLVLGEGLPTEQHMPEAFPTVQVEPYEDVLQDGHVLEQCRELKGRTRPRATDVMGFKPAIDSPAKTMVPAVGGRQPLRRLKQVVFPGPSDQ